VYPNKPAADPGPNEQRAGPTTSADQCGLGEEATGSGSGPTGCNFFRAAKVSAPLSAKGAEQSRRRAFLTSPNLRPERSLPPSRLLWLGLLGLPLRAPCGSNAVVPHAASCLSPQEQASVRCVAGSGRPPNAWLLAGVRRTKRGKAKKDHQAETEPEYTASLSRSAQVFANKGRTLLGIRFTTGDSRHNAKRSP
jgi:hypothetical protein